MVVVLTDEVRATLPPQADSVGAARRFVDAALARWGRRELADVAALLTSELVTNAVLHARTDLDVVVGATGAGVQVEVHDRSPVLPVRRDYSLAAGTGRGLVLVDELADDWGVEPGATKSVWFRLGCASASASPAVPDLDDWAALGGWDDHPPAPAHHPPVASGPGPEPASHGGGDEALVEVRLVGLPVVAWRRASEHGDELLREFALIAEQEPAERGDVPRRLVALTEDVGRRYRPFTAPTRAVLEAAAERSEASLDVTYRVPAEVGRAAAELDALLDEAEDYCRSGEALLTVAAPPDALAFRRWALGEFARQAAGLAARPWPGTDEPGPARER